jgi:hypothetical protein
MDQFMYNTKKTVHICSQQEGTYEFVTDSIADIQDVSDISADPDKNESNPAQSEPEFPPTTSALRLWLLKSETSLEHGDSAYISRWVTGGHFVAWRPPRKVNSS